GLTAKKHDLTVIRVSDPAEEELPDVGLMALRDPETGQVAWINTKSRGLRQRWRTEQEEQARYLSDLLRKSGVDLITLSTDGPVVEPLTRLFDQRRRRL
ncbi:MAG: DUF58 domain-containing protein, partial [Deltaproteobacteria bacterium]|nr:DUF58 domain-containing protein [Deltaproteobacteria bacterium]